MIIIRVGWVRRRTGRTTSTTKQTATNSASYSFSLEGKVSLKCKNLILLYRKWKYLTHRVEIVVVHDLESESIFLNPQSWEVIVIISGRHRLSPSIARIRSLSEIQEWEHHQYFWKPHQLVFFLMIKLDFSHFWNSTPGKYEKRSFLDELERPWDQEGGQL